MCTSPITIKNKSYARNGGPKYITVPCGHCKECSNVKQIDYFLRTWSIYRKYIQLPISQGVSPQWSVWFCTLTFNEENIPTSRISYHTDIENLSQDLEDLNSNVLNTYDNKLYVVSKDETRCFDHSIVSKFLKSYRQYYRRLYSKYHYEEREVVIPEKHRKDGKVIKSYTKKVRKKVLDHTETERLPHGIVTSEFGSNTHRPHYHAILFVPRVFDSWKSFQAELNRFWHYGFTCNSQLSTIDGITTERKISTAINYVLKYITKSESEMPFYLNHGDDVVLHDIPSNKYTPRVFVTDGYGAALEELLSDSSYRNNKITLNIEGTFKTFYIPSYYRRRYFKDTVIDEQREVEGTSYWTQNKKLVRTKSHIEYKNDYKALRDANYRKNLRKAYQEVTRDYKPNMSENEFVEAYLRLVEYDTPNYFRKLPEGIEFSVLCSRIQKNRDLKNALHIHNYQKEREAAQEYYSQHRILEVS